MANEKDIRMIGEYEELLLLLHQLHDDTPILERQHISLSQAFVSAQQKLESTIASSNEQINKKKQTILDEFEKDCRRIIEIALSDAQAQITDTLRKIQTEKKNVEILLGNLEIAKAKTRVQLEDERVQQVKHKKAELVDGEIYTGEELQEKFESNINNDLFVKRIIETKGKPWDNDYCMLVTEISKTRVYGEVYNSGIMVKERKSYLISDKYMIYRGPFEEEILESRE